MIGRSEQSVTALARLRRFASCNAPVLIEGETGTGKELAAREIHYASARSAKPFVPVNCGALPDSLVESELFGHCRGAFTDAKTTQIGLVEHARGGTLFLDEVDMLSLHAQVALLRFLQDREYRPIGGDTRKADVRIVAATNASLEQLADDGSFRLDLLYRLNALYLRLAPLRERTIDIEPLAEHFLAIAIERLDLPPRRWSEAAMQRLVAHEWPGNARELENATLRACLVAEGDEIEVDDLVTAVPAIDGDAEHGAVVECRREVTFRAAKHSAIESFERGYLTRLMRRAGGNVSAAARLSNIERRQLGKLLKKLGIEKQAFRDAE